MLMKFIEKPFAEALWPRIVRIISDLVGPKAWDACFLESTTDVAPVSSAFVDKLASTPAMQRLYYATFDPMMPMPSARDFAICLAFEAQYHWIGLHEFDRLKDWHFRHMAVNIRKAWLTKIIETPSLRARFKDVRDKHPASFLMNDSGCTDEVDEILRERNALMRAFFRSYTASDATETVSVWLPNKNGHVERGGNDSTLCVDVPINVHVGVPRGFYRLGFDYSISGSALDMAFLRECNRLEVGFFQGYHRTTEKLEKNGKGIWFR